MSTMQQQARSAGVAYLIVVLTGMFSLGYIPSKLVNWQDAAFTGRQIASNELLFRVDILSSATCYIAFLLLPIFLFRLLRGVNNNMAQLMVALAVVSVPMALLNLQHKYAILDLLQVPATAELPQQVNEHIMKLLENYRHGLRLPQLCWGLWLLPFGWLVFQSGFLPRLLGVLLMLGCAGYLASFVGNTLSAGYPHMKIAGYVRLPASIGEIGICLWLLVIGVKRKNVPGNIQ